MARRRSYRKRSYGRRRMKVKPSVSIMLGCVPIVKRTYDGYKAGGVKEAINFFSTGMTGYNPGDGGFNLEQTKSGSVPILMGIGVNMLAKKTGLNKYWRRIPIIGKMTEI